MPNIQRTRQSRADLATIHAFIFDNSPQNADMILRAIEEKLQKLASHTLIGKPRPELGNQLRSWVVHNFVLFYCPTNGGIQLIRVLHGSMDVVPNFFGEK